MKTTKTILVASLISIYSFGQNNEFITYSNGLIYSDETMKKLSYIADSFSLQSACDNSQIFYTKYQTIGHLVKLKTNVPAAKNDLDNQISFNEFLAKYPEAFIESDVLIIKYRYNNGNDNVVGFDYFDLDRDYSFSITTNDLSLYTKDMKGRWIYEYDEKSRSTPETLTAFYFPNNFTSDKLPLKYCSMIGYSESLIDTNVSKFKNVMSDGWIEMPPNWKSLSLADKSIVLNKLLSTRVVGGCSTDPRPRTHAVYIAQLSAETYNWEVFLKAHLDIMNDQFERMSDASYAWALRNTYIKELEQLNINVSDLLMGITFRIEDDANNHYYGNINRLGRALSETKNRTEIEQEILSVVSDTELDYYNRLMFYYLFKSYNYYLQDDAAKKANNYKLRVAAQSLPACFSQHLK